MGRKGVTVDDTTLRYCAGRVPQHLGMARAGGVRQGGALGMTWHGGYVVDTGGYVVWMDGGYG